MDLIFSNKAYSLDETHISCCKKSFKKPTLTWGTLSAQTFKKKLATILAPMQLQLSNEINRFGATPRPHMTLI